MSKHVALCSHWQDVVGRWPPPVKERHAILAKQLVAAGFEAATAGRLATERILDDLAEARRLLPADCDPPPDWPPRALRSATAEDFR
jgi:hypothetical protein